ncbi:MrpH family fimbial adhesin [Serratia ureilytica]|uniref:MrpH family fimbial adhesin n=1 Tax=Serratia ureilytica TaxID=300181 RepID=UPI001D18F47D|nr:hypothetical protein [Serratia ureilytica]MCC4106654.1 hypothetical protein [Serratia ureilytica]
MSLIKTCLVLLAKLALFPLSRKKLLLTLTVALSFYTLSASADRMSLMGTVSEDSYDNSTPPRRLVTFNWQIEFLRQPFNYNPCYKIANCYLVYGEEFEQPSFTKYATIPRLATNYETFVELFDGIPTTYSLKGKPFYIYEHVFPPNYPCIGLATKVGNTITKVSGTCQGAGGVRPPPVNCEVTTPSIVIQHSPISTYDIDGNKKEVAFRVKCDNGASVKLTVKGLNAKSQLSLSKDGALLSTLRINNSLAASGTTIRSSSAGTSVNISSTLASNGEVPAGEYTASAIMVLEVL